MIVWQKKNNRTKNCTVVTIIFLVWLRELFHEMRRRLSPKFFFFASTPSTCNSSWVSSLLLTFKSQPPSFIDVFVYELEVIFNQTWLNRSRTKNLIRREDTICATKCWFLLRNMGNPLDKHLKKCSFRLQFSQAVKRLFVCIFLSLKMFPHSFTIFFVYFFFFRLFISILQRQTCTTFAYICRHFFFFAVAAFPDRPHLYTAESWSKKWVEGNVIIKRKQKHKKIK